MTAAVFPVASLSAASVTSTAASGQGATESVGAAGVVFSVHSAVFTVTNFNAPNNVLVLVIEGNLDGSTWVTLAQTEVFGNGTTLLVPQNNGVAARIPVANVRTSAYFKGSGSPTATVTGWIASQI